MNKLIALALVAGLAPLAFADGNSSSTSANASVTILAPVLASTDGVALSFGKVIVTGQGTLAISSTGLLTPGTNGAVSLYKYNNAGTVPHLFITKDPTATVNVVIPATVAIGNGTFTPDASVFTNVASFGQSTTLSALNGTTGQAIFGVLGWSAAQSTSNGALITGTIPVSVIYN